VDSKFRAKVADFGLSQKKNLGATGTPLWMAPELLRGESTNTAASDVYSFGIILYEVYSRSEPYEGEDAEEVLKLVVDKTVNKRPPVPDGCPGVVESLMNDCVHADPEQRPTFEELDKRLKRTEVETVEPGKDKNKSQTKPSLSLFDIFPQHIAEALRDGRKVEAEHHDMVTICFSDIVGFTKLASSLSPMKVADMLDRLYHKFDDLSHKHDVFKVETIGDAYMAVTNLVKDQSGDHVKRIASFASDIIEAANCTLIDVDDPDKGVVNIRVGFHSGPVVTDVVGSRNPRYCLFGDTVNTSARMESNSETNRIQCSVRSAALLRRQDPGLPITSRGMVSMKGKGNVHTFWVNEEASKPVGQISVEFEL
jgi:class 3 adenylate cyclase